MVNDIRGLARGGGDVSFVSDPYRIKVGVTCNGIPVTTSHAPTLDEIVQRFIYGP
jgi:hypothetical protein